MNDEQFDKKMIMPISNTKMKIVIDNYFKAECDVNTSIREAFEKGFRIGVQKGCDVTNSERKKGHWSNYKDEHCCSVCKCVVISNCWDDDIRYDYCPYCGSKMSGDE